MQMEPYCQQMAVLDPYEEERTNMEINTLNFNSKMGEIISIDDVNDSEI